MTNHNDLSKEFEKALEKKKKKVDSNQGNKRLNNGKASIEFVNHSGMKKRMFRRKSGI